jgi:hypothetical protein
MKAARMNRAVLASFLVVFFGCAVEDIALVETEAQPDGDADPDGGDSGERRCTQLEECDAGEYCEMQGRFSYVGVCRPLDACASRLPVMGCDGMMYLNDCWRESRGVPASTSGCWAELRCGTSDDPACPSGAFCGKISSPFVLSEVCQPAGTCWVLPEDCGPNLGDFPLVSCAGDSAGPCTDFCSAVRSQTPHVFAFGSACSPVEPDGP